MKAKISVIITAATFLLLGSVFAKASETAIGVFLTIPETINTSLSGSSIAIQHNLAEPIQVITTKNDQEFRQDISTPKKEIPLESHATYTITAKP